MLKCRVTSSAGNVSGGDSFSQACLRRSTRIGRLGNAQRLDARYQQQQHSSVAAQDQWAQFECRVAPARIVRYRPPTNYQQFLVSLHQLTTRATMDVPAYPFVWLMAGLCLLLSVSAAIAVRICRARRNGNINSNFYNFLFFSGRYSGWE